MNFQGNIRTWAANQIASYVQDTGAADAYEVALRPVITSYTSGLLVRFKASANNTGASTLDVDGVGPISIKKNVTEDLVADDILQDEICEVVYDGTNFQLIGGHSFTLNTADTNTIHLFGTGTILDPLYAETQISGFPNNAIQVFDDGLYVPNVIQSGVVYGGIVTWLGDYDFHVSAAGYYINFVFYESPEAFITLSPADPLLDRIDTFIVDVNETASVLEGTPAPSPAQAPLDPATQLELSIVLVQAASTDPGVTTECIYLENTEWTTSTVGGTLNPDSLLNPCSGTKSVEGTSVTNNHSVLFTYGGVPFLPTTSYDVLTFKIRSKANWGNPNRRLNIQWELAGSPVGAAIQLWSGSPYGFDSSNTSDCQIISIPLSSFGFIPSHTIDSLRIRATMPNGSIGFYIDDICLQGTITPPPPPSGGTSGTSGSSGGTGTSGTSGVSGTSGTSAATAGTAGTSGTSGTSAATSGTAGSAGTSGTTGSSGTSGVNGTSGINGNSGTSGTSGQNGTSGINGTSGTSGQNGLAGTSGTSGTTAIGAPGTSGSSGTSATASGTSGSSGSSGTSAATSGTSGNGTSGTSGVSGTSGLDGTSGTSGVDGSGTSGTSGTSPAANGPYSVTNGLNENPANVFRWGGTLDSTTTINCLGFNSVFTGTSNPLIVQKTGGANANAIQASGSGASPTIQSTTNSGAGQAVLGWNNGTGIGVDGWSLSTHSIQGRRTAATNNDIVSVANLLRLSQSGSSNGIGGYLNYQIQNSGGFGVDAGRVAVKWTDNTSTLEDSQMEFWLKSAGTIAKKASISDIGQWTWDTYGSGTHTGAATRYLGVTSTGAVIEVDVPASSTDTNFAEDDLIATGNRTHTFGANTAEITYNSLAGLSGFKLSSTSTAAASNTQRLFEIALSGANSNSAQTTYALYSSNAHSGTTSVNYAGYFTATNGTSQNIGAYGTGSTYGLQGVTTSGSGVRGESTTGSGVSGLSTGGSSYGGYFESAGSSGVGVFGQANVISGIGVWGSSTTGVAAQFNKNPSSTNSIEDVVNLFRTTSGTPANGLGGALVFYGEVSNNSSQVAGRISFEWTDVTLGTRTSKFRIQAVENATSQYILEIDSNGRMVLPQGLEDYADDSAAAAGGISINGLYRNGSVVQIRVS